MGADLFHFRALEDGDIPFGMRLKGLAGWNQLPGDWRRFLTHDPDGAFIVVVDGKDAGTVTTTRYGDRFGWVGMVLVDPVFRRQGLGTALLKKAIEHLQAAGVASVRLDATPEGKMVYDRLGFVDEYRLERRQGIATSQRVSGVERISEANLEELVAFDAPVFGAERRRMLSILVDQASEDTNVAFCVRHPGGSIGGFILARPGENAWQIGPWLADTTSHAETLLQAVLNELAGRPVFLDVLCEPDKLELTSKYGFETQRPFIRMYLGENRYPGIPTKTFAIAGVETG